MRILSILILSLCFSLPAFSKVRRDMPSKQGEDCKTKLSRDVRNSDTNVSLEDYAATFTNPGQKKQKRSTRGITEPNG